jgi:hypothetical protein
VRLSTIALNSTLMNPELVCFCPTNWRKICVAYGGEVNVWSLEQFDNDRVKSTSSRFVLPTTDRDEPDARVAPQFKDEFACNNLAITNLDETYANAIEQVIDKRERHLFGAICWINADEFIVSTKANYIFKVDTMTAYLWLIQLLY